VVRPAPALAQAADRALLLRVAAGAMLLVGLFHFAA